MVDWLRNVCFNYIKKSCSKEEIRSWQECSLFCWPFKIYEHSKTKTFYFCTCEPFLCKEKCWDPEHKRLLYCYSCKMDRECYGLKGHHQHCIVYNCDACAFEDNSEDICIKLIKIDDNALETYYALTKFFTLLHCYKDFGQRDRENYNPFYDPLNFKLRGVAFCKCWWNRQCWSFINQ